MYPVYAAVGADSSDVSDRENGVNNKEEEGSLQSIIPVDDLHQQVEAPPAATISTAAATVVGKEVNTKGKGKSSAKNRDTAAAFSATAISTTSTFLGKGVSVKSRGKASAKKCGTSAVASSSVTTLDPDVLSSLGVMLSPESVQMIANLFFEIGEFARRVYETMVKKQFPSRIIDRLSMTGRVICYSTYGPMCKDFFISRCLGEYHASHRPGFIRALPGIQVLSDSSDHSALSLTGDGLLNFLSNLDGAIRSRLESIFDSRLSEISFSLEVESLSAVSCGDFVDVLNVAGVPKVVRSLVLLGFRVKREGKKRGIVPTHVETRTVRATVWMPPVVRSSELSLLSSVGNSRDEPSSDPISAGDDIPSSSAVPIFLHVQQYADSLGVKLHSNSIPLIRNFFRRFCVSVTRSFSKSICSYISTAMDSGLSIIGRSIWLKTYRELYLYSFISRCLGMYHCNYRPDFIRGLANIRVLSDSPGTGLQLSGGGLVSFLSRFDHVVRDLISDVFNSRWGVEVDKACSELENGSLDDVTYEGLIYVLDTAGVPESAFSVDQRHRERIRRCTEGTPGSSNRITSGDAASGADVTGHSLLLQESCGRSYSSRSPAAGSGPVAVSTVFGESSSSREVESIGEGVVSAMEVLLVGESTPVSSSEQPMVPVTAPSCVSAAIGGSATAAASINYFRGPKKSFMMRSARGPLGVSMSSDVASPSSSTALSSSVAPVDIGSVPLVAAATSIAAEDVDVGARRHC
ncbi:hypothetical protein [Candidatus Ichthyocystis hellenicum]|uniref:hypothetical protein n=1 Tax=Candidatus Ichthyocystis hellenicum TaxID=1561003 RepID=UPI001111C3A5|nr:hypothetical protein [Candidatus Ichthyocystis hellenicum]